MYQSTTYIRIVCRREIKDLTEVLLSTSDQGLLFHQINEAKLLVATVQADLIDPLVAKKLEYLAKVIVKVMPGQNSPSQGAFELIQKQAGGKVSRDQFSFQIDASGVAHQIELLKKASSIAETPKVTLRSSGPVSSFNLGMTAAQKASKDSVILPHMRSLSLSQQVEQLSVSRPILADDFDDEDPDEDLDI